MYFGMITILTLYTSIVITERLKYRIVGGKSCPSSYNFAVSLVKSEKPYHFCGGSLIKLNWVLTAAHCLTPYLHSYYDLKINAGVSKTFPLGTQQRTPNKLFISDQHNRWTLANDIGLILLNESFIGSQYVKTINLIPRRISGDLLQFCKSGTVLGWGVRNLMHPNEIFLLEKYVYDGDLQCVELPLITDDKCKSLISTFYILHSTLREDVFCALHEIGGKDACIGDSGGPFICKDVQIGIVSTGYGCASPNVPALYTRVDRQLHFIEKTIQNIEIRIALNLKSNSNSYSFSHLLLLYIIVILNIIIFK